MLLWRPRSWPPLAEGLLRRGPFGRWLRDGLHRCRRPCGCREATVRLHFDGSPREAEVAGKTEVRRLGGFTAATSGRCRWRLATVSRYCWGPRWWGTSSGLLGTCDPGARGAGTGARTEAFGRGRQQAPGTAAVGKWSSFADFAGLRRDFVSALVVGEGRQKAAAGEEAGGPRRDQQRRR